MGYDYKTKDCVECQEEFKPTSAGQRCCSTKCLKIKETEYNRKYTQKYRKTERGSKISKEISKRYYLNNKEKIKKKSNENYNKNKEEYLLKRKEYREKNPEKVKESKRISYQKNIEKNNIKGRIYNQNPERKIKNSIRGLTRYHFNDKKNKCDKCDSTEDLEFHHLEPYKAEVFEILCKKHHLEEHNKPKQIKIEDIFN